MDFSEFSKFVSAIRAYYPKEKLLPDKESMTLWYKQISDIPYDTALLVIDKWVATNDWSPSIAAIRQLANEVTVGETPDWGEAWKIVMEAASSKYGYYKKDEAFEFMGEMISTCVERTGDWGRDFCHTQNIDNTRANFRMIYEAEAKKRKREAQVSPAVRDRIGSVQLKAIDEVIK